MSGKAATCLRQEIRHQDGGDGHHGDADLHQGDEGATRLLVRRIVVARRSRVFEFAMVGRRISPNLAPARWI